MTAVFKRVFSILNLISFFIKKLCFLFGVKQRLKKTKQPWQFLCAWEEVVLVNKMLVSNLLTGL